LKTLPAVYTIDGVNPEEGIYLGALRGGCMRDVKDVHTTM